MQHLKARWQAFLLVLDSSADTELAIVAALILPVLIPVLGTLVMAGSETANTFSPVVEAVRDKAYLILLALAAFAYVGLGKLARSIYRRDRKRLLGY